MGYIHDPAAGKLCLRQKMVVKDMHLLDSVKFSPNSPLICHNETGNIVLMEQGQRVRCARHPDKIIHKMGIAMVDIQRLVTVKEHSAAPRCHVCGGIFLW